jgi:putative Mg2+ transporter-C (MgtC) family protein
MMDALISTGDINLCNGLFRLFLGLVAGGLIGINREKYNRAAGFRTHILICMGSCLIMLVSIYIPQEFLNFKNGDPGRIAAQVVTGIGFLGAGAIIKLGDHVKGLTTAASIWVSAAIGMAIGAGMFWISLGAVLLVLLTLIVLERLERLIFRKRMFKSLSIQIKQPTANLDAVEQILKDYKVKHEIQEVRQNTYMGIVNLEISITVDSHFPLEKFINSFTGIPNLQEITVRNKL